MSNLEDRLRSELARSGGQAKIGTAPSIDTLAGVASSRHRRNRVGGSAVLLTLVAGLFVAAFLASQTPQTSAVVAAGGEEDGSVAASPSEAAASETGAEADTAPQSAEAESVDESTTDVTEEESTEAVVEDDVDTDDVGQSDEAATSLQSADPTSAVVETRSSAVSFFGSSGVLITQTDAGFAGLATRFGDSGAETLGLASPNGLDWEEVVLDGPPEGATAVSLETFQGTHVAVFERNVLGERAAWVGTSNDLVSWELSDPLEGGFVIAQHLLVGPNGVVILGDSEEPDVWVGPIGGPYVAQEQVPTDFIAFPEVVDGEFVVFGFDSATAERQILRSMDGITWTAEVFVDDGSLSPGALSGEARGGLQFGRTLFSLPGSEGTTSYVSRDLGETWTAIEHGPGIGNETRLGDFIASDEAVAFFGGEDLFTVVFSSGGEVTVVELPDVATVRRANFISIDVEQVIVLVETEAGLDWIVVSHP